MGDLAEQRIAIIDYGMGNLRSVEKAFEKVGAAGAFITSDPVAVAKADKAVLPGDGAFDATMRSLRASGVDRVALGFIASGRPFLGICVGMQVLLTSSEEGDEGVRGLDVVPGRVRRFDKAGGLKIPQIGWNGLAFAANSPLGAGLTAAGTEPADNASPVGNPAPDDPMAYFLHSYYCVPDDDGDIAAVTEYGVSYCSALHKGNVWATQFHPEKSGMVGLTILKNFVRIGVTKYS